MTRIELSLVVHDKKICYDRTTVLSSYIAQKLKGVRYKILKDGTYFGEIPGLRGVWANAKNLEDCRKELESALGDWILFTLKDGGSLPGLCIGVDRHAW